MRTIRVLSDYHQIFVHDPAGPGPAKGTADDLQEVMLELGEQGFTIGTLSATEVKVDIDVAKSEPDVTLEEWDHAVRGGFASSSGQLKLWNPGAAEDELFEVPAGALTVLVLAAGLAEEDARDLGLDRYRVHIWPGGSGGGDVEVLKQFDWSQT